MNEDRRDDFVVVVHSGSDRTVSGALKALAGYVGSGARQHAAISVRVNASAWTDPIADISTTTGSVQTEFLDYLARHFPQLRTLRIVSVVATEVDDQTCDQLDAFTSRLRVRISEMSSQISCLDFRVAFPEYGAPIPGEPFFTAGANANLIVIPRDSSSHDAMAKPIVSSQPEVYVGHVAIELATISGLWREMEASVIDQFERIPTGTSDILVRYVSSRSSYLVCPPLPIEKLMSDEGDLPLPHHFYPIPEASKAAGKLARQVYPAVLRYQPTPAPSGAVIVETNSKMRRRYVGELATTALSVPRVLIKGVQGYLENLSGEALQEALGGSNSSVEVIYPGRYVGGEATPLDEESVQRFIDDVAERLDRPVLTTLGEDLWLNLVQRVIAVADGGNAAAEIRAEYADEKYLLVEKAALGPTFESTAELVKGLFVEPVLRSPQDSKEDELEGAGRLNNDSRNRADGQPSINESIQAGQNDAFDSRVDSPVERSSTGQISNEHVVLEESGAGPSGAEETNLLREITRQMAGEQDVARSRAEEMVRVLLELPGRFKARDAHSISLAAKISMALGVAVAYFANGSLTERRKYFNFEFLGPSSRDLLLVLVSLCVIFVSLFSIFFQQISRSQGRIIGFTTAGVLSFGSVVAFWSPIRDFVLKLEFLRRSATIGAGIIALTAVLVVVAVLKGLSAAQRLRRMFAVALGWGTGIYLLIGITAFMGSKRSSFRDFSASTRARLFLLLVLVGVSLILVTCFVVAHAIVKERYRLQEVVRNWTWATNELAESADAERRLRLASVQWVGTAAVLARLFKYPLGSNYVNSESVHPRMKQDAPVLKFEEHTLVLTRRGEQGLAARLRQLFIGQGWLDRQYRQLISRFQEDLAFSRGLLAEETRAERPESCSSLPTLDDVLNDRAKGPRWWFMKTVLSGDYDSSLLGTTSEVQLEDAYSTVVGDPDAHYVGSSGITAPEFFRRLVPSQRMQIPGGLVKTLFSGADERRYLSAHVWWPDELLENPLDLPRDSELRRANIKSPSGISEPFRLFGSCVLVSHPFKLTEARETIVNDLEPSGVVTSTSEGWSDI